MKLNNYFVLCKDALGATKKLFGMRLMKALKLLVSLMLVLSIGHVAAGRWTDCLTSWKNKHKVVPAPMPHAGAGAASRSPRFSRPHVGQFPAAHDEVLGALSTRADDHAAATSTLYRSVVPSVNRASERAGKTAARVARSTARASSRVTNPSPAVAFARKAREGVENAAVTGAALTRQRTAAEGSAVGGAGDAAPKSNGFFQHLLKQNSEKPTSHAEFEDPALILEHVLEAKVRAEAAELKDVPAFA